MLQLIIFIYSHFPVKVSVPASGIGSPFAVSCQYLIHTFSLNVSMIRRKYKLHLVYIFFDTNSLHIIKKYGCQDRLLVWELKL